MHKDKSLFCAMGMAFLLPIFYMLIFHENPLNTIKLPFQEGRTWRPEELSQKKSGKEDYDRVPGVR